MRLFVAVEMPDRVGAALSLLQRPIDGARWVSRENLHLTLRFIGDADAVGAEDLDRGLAALAAPGFDRHVHGIGTFGSDRRIRALWAGVMPAPGLLALQETVERVAQGAGFEASGRKYVPHVTLARMDWGQRGRRSGIKMGPQLDALMVAHAGLDIPAFPVTSFVLMSSVLTRDGPYYAVEARYRLAAA